MDAELPFLVRHGDLVWRAALVALPVLGAGWRWASPRRLARRRARRWRRAQPAPTRPADFEEGAEVVVRARLSAETAAALWPAVHAATLEATGRPEAWVGEGEALELALDDGGTLALEGPLRVRAGALELRPAARLKRGQMLHARACQLPGGPAAAARLSGHRVAVAGLRDGDLVLARGVLRRRAEAAGEAGYRESRGRWVLTGTGARPVELGPVGSPRVPRTDRRRLLSGVGLGLVAFAALFLALPAATERATRAADGDTPEVDAVLAATPFRRRALARLTTAAARAPRSEASVARWTALVDRTHGCDGVAQTLVEAGRPERAIEAAEACPRLHAQLAKVRGEYALARFADAVQTFRATPVTDDDLRWSPTKGVARPGRDGEAYARAAARAQLTQHRWRSAARALEPLYGPGPRCAADAARGRSGEEPEWLDRDDPVCRVLWADEEARERGIWVGSESGRRALVGGGLLGGLGGEVGLPPTRTERGALAARVEMLRRLADAGADGDLTGFGPAELLLPTSAVCPLDGASVPALEAEALAADRPDVLPALRVHLLLRRALFEATTLRPARAEALLARARVIAAEEGGSPVEVERVAETVRRWREGPRESAERRVGLAPRMGSLAGLHLWEPHAALREDATLAERLRHAPRPGMAPFRSMLCHAAGLARAAEVIGAADVAERERGVVERLRAALEDRDIALMLWSVDSMPRY